MVKVGDIVKWNAGKQGMLSGKVTGGEKGKRWRIESKGKRYYVPKEDVKKGAVKRAKKAPAPAKKAEPKKTPAPDKDTLQKVMGVMAEVAKGKGKTTQKQIDTELGNKFDPLNTRPLPVNTWTPVKIFTEAGTGKGKVYEAYFKKDFTNEIRRRKPNPYPMGSEASMNWGDNAAHYTKWEDMKSSVIIIRDVKSKNIIGGIHLVGSTEKYLADDIRYEAPRRHFRFENKDAYTKTFPIERVGGEYKFPKVVSQDLILAPSKVQKYYGYSEKKAISGEDQENEFPNDSIIKMKFKPALKDIEKLDFKITNRF